MIQNNNKMATILSRFVFVFLVILGTASAKRYGGGGYGGGGYGANIGGSKTPGSIGFVSNSRPIQSSGGGYASSSRSAYYQPYNRYPNYGYGPSLYGGFFLGSSYRRSQYTNNRNNTTSNNNNDDDYDTYFDRIENGCELTGVDSYRTIDTSNNATSIWTGCSEEWRYNIGLVKTMWSSSSSSSSSNTPSIASNFTFISPPLELYACSENDSCSACEDELKGKEFDALTLEVLDYPNMAYPIDCYVPKNLSLVQENFNCVNDECIFLSEKYDYLSSDAAATIITTISTTTFFWTVLASSVIGMTLLL